MISIEIIFPNRLKIIYIDPYFRLLADSPMSLETVDEVSRYLTGDYPVGLKEYTNVAVLGVFSSSQHQEEIQAFTAAAAELHGEFVLASAYYDVRT